MENSKVASNGKPNVARWNPFLVAIVSAIIGSGSGVALVFNTPVGESFTRPDPFTGVQGLALEREITELKAQITFHVREHPDKTNQFDRRITVLETQQQTILLVLTRIENKLDRVVQ